MPLIVRTASEHVHDGTVACHDDANAKTRNHALLFVVMLLFVVVLGYTSMLFTIGADVKRNNTCIDPQHLGIEIGPDSALAAVSTFVGNLMPEPIIDTAINVHSVANDTNNLAVDEAAIQGFYATPPIPVLKPQGPILIRPADWLLGPFAKIIYSALGGSQ